MPLELAPLVHDLSRTYNVHPVYTLLYLLDHSQLLQHKKQLLYVIEQLFERQMRQKETNEVLSVIRAFIATITALLQIKAFKLHIILMTLKEAFDFIGKQNNRDAEAAGENAEAAVAANDE